MRNSPRIRLVASAIVLAVLLVGTLSVLSGCGEKSDEKEPASVPSETGTRTFTIQELAGFNGQNGNPAYVAVDGIVYDVSGSPNWPAGKHSPCNLEAAAGRDLSEVIKQAPSEMRGYIEGKPVVGRLQGD